MNKESHGCESKFRGDDSFPLAVESRLTVCPGILQRGSPTRKWLSVNAKASRQSRVRIYISEDHLAEISSIRSIGNRARSRMALGSSMRGARFFMHASTFSSVFIFMYLHSLQRHLSPGIRSTSNAGAQRNSLPGHSFCIRWM